MADIRETIRVFGAWLDQPEPKSREQLQDTLLWIRKYVRPYASPNDVTVLRQKVCTAFRISETELEPLALGIEQSSNGAPYQIDLTDDMSDIVPKKGWLADYLRYTSYTEAPTAYHLWLGITIVGACLRRRVWLDRGLWKIYPNMVVFLVGPSTKTRKTTASDIAVRLALEAGQIRLLAEKVTPEALVNALAEGSEAHGLIYVPEIASTFTRQKYQEGLIPLLTRLWDCPDILPTDTITRSKQILYQVCVAMIGCSNTTWLAKLPEDAFGGGFMARIIQVYQSHTIRRFAWPQSPEKSLRENLIDKLTLAGMINGEILKTPKGKEWFEARYNSIMDSIPDDERLAPFYGRLGDHILRLAMILLLAETNFEARPDIDLVALDEPHIEQADVLMRWVLRYLPKIYETLGATPIGEEGAKILRYIETQGGHATRPQLLRYTKSRILRKQLDEILNTLVDSNDITADHNGLWPIYHRVKR